jgi:hypothetical protein
MSRDRFPYVNRCSRCGNGLLRLCRCGNCAAVAAICDECELVWQDVARVSGDAAAPSDAFFPMCPRCRAASWRWTRLNLDAIRAARLETYVAGESS